MIRPKLQKPTPAESRRAYALVRARSGGICEGCGKANATDVHHRHYRGRGGWDVASNLIHLCGGPSGLAGGNHSGCHGIAHSKAGEDRGWSVRSCFTPADMPLDHALHGRVLLDDGGGWSPYVS
jgi:hypothetical protein